MRGFVHGAQSLTRLQTAARRQRGRLRVYAAFLLLLCRADGPTRGGTNKNYCTATATLRLCYTLAIRYSLLAYVLSLSSAMLFAINIYSSLHIVHVLAERLLRRVATSVSVF